MKFPWQSKELATTPRPTDDGRLLVRVGVTYPSMFGHGPSDLTVTRIVADPVFGSIVYYTNSNGLKYRDPIETFCRDIARRIAYDRPLQEVDVTEMFEKLGLPESRKGR